MGTAGCASICARRLRKKIYGEVAEETEKRVIVIDSIVQLYV